MIQVLAVLLLAGCGKDKASKNFSGTWDSAQWGVMALVQSGTVVSGQWEYQNGRLQGNIVDGKLTFKWWQNVEPGAPYEDAANADRGDGYFILAADAQSFAGKWRLHGRDRWNDDWDAIRALGSNR
ncbi:MAG: hypothetical protein O2923_00835 [Verrucomicrobia bacterium]|nr:hypothetical protein [Verrucomicrobiota bacterium]MDA1086121.1 hypothetical protein [Verrucomicrobiota bacterium]